MLSFSPGPAPPTGRRRASPRCYPRSQDEVFDYARGLTANRPEPTSVLMETRLLVVIVFADAFLRMGRAWTPAELALLLALPNESLEAKLCQMRTMVGSGGDAWAVYFFDKSDVERRAIVLAAQRAVLESLRC